jgi:nucleosome assembly protein 1-like 1
MSSNVPIASSNITAPTPQNTPLTQAPIAHGLSRPTVPDISEDNEQQDGSEAEAGGELAGLEHHMLGMVHGKLSDLIGKSSGYIESLPTEVKLSVEALKGVQVKQNELHNKYKHECLELEKKVHCQSPKLVIHSNLTF